MNTFEDTRGGIDARRVSVCIPSPIAPTPAQAAGRPANQSLQDSRNTGDRTAATADVRALFQALDDVTARTSITAASPAPSTASGHDMELTAVYAAPEQMEAVLEPSPMHESPSSQSPAPADAPTAPVEHTQSLPSSLAALLARETANVSAASEQSERTVTLPSSLRELLVEADGVPVATSVTPITPGRQSRRDVTVALPATLRDLLAEAAPTPAAVAPLTPGKFSKEELTLLSMCGVAPDESLMQSPVESVASYCTPPQARTPLVVLEHPATRITASQPMQMQPSPLPVAVAAPPPVAVGVVRAAAAQVVPEPEPAPRTPSRATVEHAIARSARKPYEALRVHTPAAGGRVDFDGLWSMTAAPVQAQHITSDDTSVATLTRAYVGSGVSLATRTAAQAIVSTHAAALAWAAHTGRDTVAALQPHLQSAMTATRSIPEPPLLGAIAAARSLANAEAAPELRAEADKLLRDTRALNSVCTTRAQSAWVQWRARTHLTHAHTLSTHAAALEKDVHNVTAMLEHMQAALSTVRADTQARLQEINRASALAALTPDVLAAADAHAAATAQLSAARVALNEEANLARTRTTQCEAARNAHAVAQAETAALLAHVHAALQVETEEKRAARAHTRVSEALSSAAVAREALRVVTSSHGWTPSDVDAQSLTLNYVYKTDGGDAHTVSLVVHTQEGGEAQLSDAAVAHTYAGASARAHTRPFIEWMYARVQSELKNSAVRVGLRLSHAARVLATAHAICAAVEGVGHAHTRARFTQACREDAVISGAEQEAAPWRVLLQASLPSASIMFAITCDVSHILRPDTAAAAPPVGLQWIQGDVRAADQVAVRVRAAAETAARVYTRGGQCDLPAFITHLANETDALVGLLSPSSAARLPLMRA